MGHRKCEEALGRLYLYLDGEVTWYRRWRIKRHLRACNGCGPAFSFETKFQQVVRERLREQPPPEMMGRLQQFLRDQSEGRPPD
ncbi:MAG TPA: zf-HC2 domain-containing protein [Acidimicrobiia bacterium]